ncbi:MAG: hypothetical protein ACD_79C00262G0002 [uncultured bacterium]|nr:MAG: hypothetical protein ACD_79C00262G0002 [uncultured bacterium]
MEISSKQIMFSKYVILLIVLNFFLSTGLCFLFIKYKNNNVRLSISNQIIIERVEKDLAFLLSKIKINSDQDIFLRKPFEDMNDEKMSEISLRLDKLISKVELIQNKFSKFEE